MIDKVDDNGTIYNYSYDKLGNITEVKKDNTLTNKYYYDMYSQLIKEMESISFEQGDLYYAFHKANIRVSCTWFRGYPTYLVTFSDTYNFTEYFDDPGTLGQYANNLGYEMQKNGQLEEYYINMTFEYR